MEFQNYANDLHNRKNDILQKTSVGGNYYAVGCMDTFKAFVDFLSTKEGWSVHKITALYRVFIDTFLDKS